MVYICFLGVFLINTTGGSKDEQRTRRREDEVKSITRDGSCIIKSVASQVSQADLD